MKLTDKMVDALQCTIDFESYSVLIMSHPRTQRALFTRGLATESGALTKNGKAVRAYLQEHPTVRNFTASIRTLIF